MWHGHFPKLYRVSLSGGGRGGPWGGETVGGAHSHYLQIYKIDQIKCRPYLEFCAPFSSEMTFSSKRFLKGEFITSILWEYFSSYTVENRTSLQSYLMDKYCVTSLEGVITCDPFFTKWLEIRVKK